jgi:uncharacterized membrane protein YsdA (DUF1294 family)
MKLYLSLIFGVGIGAWVFNKTTHRTNRSQTGVIVAFVIGLIAFIVFYTLYSFTKK